MLRGEVVLSTASSATLTLFNGETIIVYATTTNGTTTMPKLLRTGDDVVVLGKFIGNNFEVMRIRPTHRGPFGTQMRRNHSDMHLQIIQINNK